MPQASGWFDFVLVAVLGALVGIGELVSRYRDAPAKALSTGPAILYVALNAAAAAFALWTIRVFEWNLGVDATRTTQLRWTQVLAGGFGAMALFRSSLFTIRAGDQDIGVGPVSFLNVVLGAADRAVDRLRARARSTAVAEAMANVSFRRAQAALPAYCLALMQNLPREDQENLARQVTALGGASFDHRIKSMTLGLNLMDAVGSDVLDAAIRSLGSLIMTPSSLELGLPARILVGEQKLSSLHVFGPDKEILPRDGVAWRSEDQTIVTVSDAGLVTGVAPGKTRIVAELDDKIAEFEIIVEPLAPLTAPGNPGSIGPAASLSPDPMTDPNRIA